MFPQFILGPLLSSQKRKKEKVELELQEVVQYGGYNGPDNAENQLASGCYDIDSIRRKEWWLLGPYFSGLN